MQRIDAQVGDIVWVGNTPIGASMAHGGRLVLWTPTMIEESEDTLRRHLQRQAARGKSLTERRGIGDNTRRRGEDGPPGVS